MKQQLANTLTKIGFLIAIALVTSVGSAQGQTLATRIKVNIPFDFVVADKKLPAGEYTVSRARVEASDRFVAISSKDGRTNAFRLTSPVWSRIARNKGTLVFHRYGEEYFLSQVWAAGATTGRALVKSKIERATERKAASDTPSAMIDRKTQNVETVNIVVDAQ